MADSKPMAVPPQGFPRVEEDQWSIRAWAAFLILGVGLFLPTTVFYLFETSSTSPGLILAGVVIFGAIGFGATAAPSTVKMVNAATIAGVVMAGILAHALIATYVFRPELGRTLASTVAVGVLIFVALTADDAVFRHDERVLRRWTNWLRILFVLIGIWGMFGIQPPHSRAVQPIFPFTEPSHYALAFTPLIIDGCIRSRGWKRLALIGAAFLIAFFLKSLSLVVGTTFAAAISLPTIRFLTFMTLGYIGVRTLDISYFVDRLDIDVQSENLSTLVWIQGWELVRDAFERSNGWGIGFQQLGFAPIMSPTADRIYRFFGVDFNLQDGGFNAAKLLSEFGALAVILLVGYLLVFVRAAWALRLGATGRAQIDPQVILPLSFICAYFIELFVRGGGYFSGTGLFVVMSIAFVWRNGLGGVSVVPRFTPPAPSVQPITPANP